ncbi:hypothetical protein UFOVP735_11 [uncultured Caudovirales phage]|uniref:Uncharacterized protein n=1 Tax=uncultured Caudovirales phage TaxID=2100421 RepID=A0A6J7X0E6_9CAUD|nr:hypothetical protein UFOVP735_11 [uncultured Caudovirales phage]
MPYTYTTLTNDVIANMEEDSAEFVSALPSIIERAQSHLQRRLDPVNIIRFTEISVSASNRTLTLPADLLVLKSIQVCATGGWNNLLEQNNEFLTAYWPDYTSVAPSKYYAPKDNASIYLAPTPPANTTALVEYIPRVTVLSSTNPTNYFATYTDAAFFAASMMFANAWTKNAGAVTLWKGILDEELAVLNNESTRARRSDTVNRYNGSPENTIGGQP